MAFTLAMVENPHVWKRAQAEIDAVVGPDRLPEFDDRQSLPYVGAVIREVMRWIPVFPLGACWEVCALSEGFLTVFKVACARLCRVISTMATTYPKV